MRKTFCSSDIVRYNITSINENEINQSPVRIVLYLYSRVVVVCIYINEMLYLGRLPLPDPKKRFRRNIREISQRLPKRFGGEMKQARIFLFRAD